MPGALLIKRDDATGLAGGGNKARKLEHLCADAQARGCDTLVTGGTHAGPAAGFGDHTVLSGSTLVPAPTWTSRSR